MDPKRFDGLKSQLAHSLSLAQCIELEAIVGRILSERAGEAAIAKKARQIAEGGKCPRCGGVKVTKHGRDARGVQRFRCSPTSGCGKTFNPLTGTPENGENGDSDLFCRSLFPRWPFPAHEG
jgi:transposase-like protein